MESARLQRLRALLEGPVVADIGTDHGIVPMSLLADPSFERIVASDISAASLAKLRRKLKDHPEAARVTTVVTDGLAGIDTREVNTVLIAGMGGHRIVRILEKAVASGQPLHRLVLSPQRGEGAVRRFLREAGFRLFVDEYMEEEGKFYTLLAAEPGEEVAYAPLEEKFGRMPLRRRDPVLREWARKELAVCERVLAGLPEESQSHREVQARRAEWQEVLDVLQNQEYMGSVGTDRSLGDAGTVG